jgi:hypothetical protein
MHWVVERTVIREYDQGNKPPQFKAIISLERTDVTEVVTIKELRDLLVEAVQQYNIPAKASLTEKVELHFVWDNQEPVPDPEPPPP